MVFFSKDFHKLVTIKRKKRARRFTLRVCQLTGHITLTIPLRASISYAKDFLLENSDWVNAQLKQVIPRNYVSIGTKIPIGWVEREIMIQKLSERRHNLEPTALHLDCNEVEVGSATKNFLVDHATKVLTPIIEENAEHIKRKIKSIRFKDTKSRWGSCSSTGSLMVNWRLIMAPPSVYRYVAIHEVSHLKYMNHGADFWRLVESLHPHYREDRFWLKDNGRKLKTFIFEISNAA